jgi:hypothetical protein
VRRLRPIGSGRGRDEPPEIVQVTLPEWSAQEGDPANSVTLRIPEQGGLPAAGSRLPRGLLLLTVVADVQPDSGVRRATVSLAPPPATHPARVPAPRRSNAQVIAVAVAVALFIGFLLWLRWTGRG